MINCAKTDVSKHDDVRCHSEMLLIERRAVESNTRALQ